METAMTQELQLDLLPYPMPPWQHAFTTLTVFAEVDEAPLRDLVPQPLGLREPLALFASMWFDSSVPTRPYHDAAVIVPVSYQGIDGGYWVHGFTSTDQVLSGTREIWGYRMKLADRIEVEGNENGAHGSIDRLGKKVFSIEMTPGDSGWRPPQTFPRLFLKMLPRANQAVPLVKTVVEMKAETQVETEIWGQGMVAFEPSEDDPVHLLEPRKVLGASLLKGTQTLVWGEELP
jgi:acetoacetate decarboxylase